ncbi:MAG: hypothetical protein K2L70_05870 [Clostridia bacterium]|nr:hypothetical protein [Clostridia bacterium]
MRNKKLFVMIAVMLLVVFTLSLALVACKKKPIEGDTPSGEPGEIDSGEEKPPWKPPVTPPDTKPVIPEYAKSFRGAVSHMIESMPSEYLSMNFTGTVTLNGERYTMSLKGNLAEGDIQVSAVFRPEGTNDLKFAFYITNSKFFIELEDGTIYNVAEIDANYLASIVDTLPDKLSGIIKDLLGNYVTLVPTILDILLGGFSPSDKIVYEEVNGVETFELAIDVQGFLNPISTLLKPGGLLGGFLPEGLDISFVSELLNMIPLMDGQLKATVDNGKLSEFNFELYDNDPQSENYRQTIVGLDSALVFSNEPLTLEIPDGLDNYEVLTLGNLNADFTLTIDTNGESFDIGAVIDEFLPKPIFGEGILMLDGDAEYKLDIKASLDPNLEGLDEDKNYVNAVLWAGTNELVRINYLDGKLYVKALANGVNGFADGGINVAIPLDLKDYISKLVNLVTNAIDGFLGTQFAPNVPSGAMLTASVNERGETILSPSLQSVIMGVLKLVGFEESVILSGDKITVVIDEVLFKAISEIAKIDLDLPLFGELVLGLYKGGIEYVEVKAMDVLTLRAENFLIGKAKVSRQDIEDSIGNIGDYGTDIESIILSFALSLLSDLDLSLDLDLSTVNTTVNLTPVINNIMAVANSSTYLKMPITLDLSNYDGVFKLRIATNYDEENAEGRILLELITPNGDTLISAYNENDSTYVDLSGLGFMKFCLTHVNLFQMLRGLLGADTFTEDFIEEVAPAMAMTAYSSGVEIGSDYIGVAVDSYFVTLIMRMLSMDLGIDVDLDAHLNFDGSVNAQLGLGNAAKLGLSLSLGKESQSENRIKDVINNLPKAEYGEYNAVDAEMLVDSILVSERLNLTLDLYNNNVDYPSHENKTRIVIRNSSATAPGLTERLDNGLEAPYKSIVLAIYAGWNNTTSEALLFGYIDFDGKKIQIKGTERMLSVNLVVYQLKGDILDIPINNVDLKGMLVNALSGLFGDATDGDNEDFGGAIEVPDGALPPQKPNVTPSEPTEPVEPSEPTDPSEPSEPTPSIEEILPGVKITLTGSMDVDVDVDINGSYISKVLKDLLSGVLTDLDLTSMGVDGLITVNYDNENPNVFFNDLYSKVVLPIIKQQVTNAVAGMSFIGQIVGAIANNDNIKNQVHSLVQRFLPLPNIEDLAVNVSLTDGKLANISAIGSNSNSEYGFGIYIFNRKVDEVVSWENQATQIYFNPNLGGNLIDMFETRARKHVLTNWEVDSWQNITWTLKNSGTDLATFSANVRDYTDGEYIFVGSAWDATIEVKVTLHSAEIESIKDMQVKAMRDIPTYVTAVFTDGTERLLTNVEILCDGRVNGENNASVTLGGEPYEFTIVFEEEDITLDTLVLNAYDYLDVIEALETSGVIKVKVNDSFYRNLPATYNFEAIKAMTRQELQKPNTYQVDVHVGAGTQYERDMVLTVEFTPFEIYYIERNGLNYIETDFIEYAKGESFPDEITVVGYNGKEQLKYTAKVSEWDISGVTIDLKGGQYMASAILNAGEYNEWKMYGIEVDVLSTDIVELADSNKSVVFDWKYYFYGGVSIDKVLPSLLKFKTSDGTIKKDVPVTIDVSSIFADEATVRKAMVEGMTFDCPLTVDVENNGKSLLETTIQVVVPAIKMSLIETTIDIDYNEYMKYGKSAFFRDSIEIMLGKDKVTANVTWFTDEVTFNKDGTYTAIVYLDQNGEYEQSCEVTVNITGAPTTNTKEV